MTDKESEAYFILADNMIHVVKNGIRLCTDESDINVKYDLRIIPDYLRVIKKT